MRFVQIRRAGLGLLTALAFTVALLTLPALASAQTTLSGSVSLSNNAVNATALQDTFIVQQYGTPVSISGGSVVVTLPSNQSLPSGWSVSDVTTDNIPSPGTITQSGNTITIPFTGDLSSSTNVTVIVTDVSNSGTAGSASATVDEDNSSGTVESTGSFSETLSAMTAQAAVTVAEAVAISPAGPSAIQFSIDPASFTQDQAVVGGIQFLSDAASTAVTLTATTPTDSTTGVTLPWGTSVPGMTFTPILAGVYQTPIVPGSTAATLTTFSGPTGSTAYEVLGSVDASINWSQEAGTYNTTLTYGVSPTY